MLLVALAGMAGANCTPWPSFALGAQSGIVAKNPRDGEFVDQARVFAGSELRRQLGWVLKLANGQKWFVGFSAGNAGGDVPPIVVVAGTRQLPDAFEAFAKMTGQPAPPVDARQHFSVEPCFTSAYDPKAAQRKGGSSKSNS